MTDRLDQIAGEFLARGAAAVLGGRMVCERSDASASASASVSGRAWVSVLWGGGRGSVCVRPPPQAA